MFTHLLNQISSGEDENSSIESEILCFSDNLSPDCDWLYSRVKNENREWRCILSDMIQFFVHKCNEQNTEREMECLLISQIKFQVVEMKIRPLKVKKKHQIECF